MGASDAGGADPDSMANAGLGVKGVTFHSSYRGGCSVMWMGAVSATWMSGWRPRDGGSHGWLSGGLHGGGDGFPLGRVGGKRCSGG